MAQSKISDLSAAASVADGDFIEIEDLAGPTSLKATAAQIVKGARVKDKMDATVAPGATDDSAAGYAVGSKWVDVSADKAYMCVDATATAAVWTEITQAGGGLANVVEDTTPQLGGTLDTNSKQVRWSKGADVASAATLTLGTDGNYFDITGTTTITAIGALAVGTVVRLHFDAALTLTHHATDLVLPTGANITTAAGDEAEFVEYAAADWRCTNYTKADGTPLAGGGGLSNVVEDLTPQLGGDLDLNGKNIDFPTTPNVSDCLDEDNMASDSATKLATQQSIKAYADTKLANVVEDTTPQLGGALDLNAKGITEEFTAGEAVADNDLCYLKSDGKFWKADADAAATADGMLAIATATISADATGTFLVFGRKTTSGLTAGSTYYVSTTLGAITATAPSATGDIVRIVGHALSTTVLFFNPDQTYIEIA